MTAGNSGSAFFGGSLFCVCPGKPEGEPKPCGSNFETDASLVCFAMGYVPMRCLRRIPMPRADGWRRCLGEMRPSSAGL